MHSSRPRSRSEVLERRRRRWLGVRRPTAERRAGSVVGSLWSPWIRATSSIRSSRCTSLSRQGGTTQPPSARSNPSRSRSPPRCRRDLRSERLRDRSCRRSDARLRGRYVDRPRHHARAAQVDHQPRRQPLGGHRLLGVKLLLEAGRAPGAPAPSRSMMFGPTQVAASISTRVVASETSETCRP